MNEQTRNDIVKYRCQKARQLMCEVDYMMAWKLWNSTVNRLYYACFHIVTALLIHSKIEDKSHAGVRLAFGNHFIRTHILPNECAHIFSRIFDKRQASDYDDFRSFTQEEVENLIPQAKHLIDTVEKYIEQQHLLPE